MKWAPADVAQLTYLRAQGATYEAIADVLSRPISQITKKIHRLIQRGAVTCYRPVRRAAKGCGSTFAANLGIEPDALPDYHLLRSRGFTADEAVQMIRAWAA